MTGTTWIEESGALTMPVLVTNTHSVGACHTGSVRWVAGRRPDLGATWLLPVVAETWDGYLNDINGGHVTPEITMATLDAATTGPVAEGSVGGGTGMNCYGFKGGSGTSSRVVAHAGDEYVVAAFVQANFGSREELTIAGVHLGHEFADDNPMMESDWLSRDQRRGGASGAGSVIVVVATDAPLLPHQCKALARRVPLGLARTGTAGGHFSGDIFLAFSTANPGALASEIPLGPPTADEAYRLDAVRALGTHGRVLRSRGAVGGGSGGQRARCESPPPRRCHDRARRPSVAVDARRPGALRTRPTIRPIDRSRRPRGTTMKRVRTSGTVAIGLVLALTVAACGGADAPTTATDAPAVTDAPDATETPDATDAPDATDGPDATDAPDATTGGSSGEGAAGEKEGADTILTPAPTGEAESAVWAVYRETATIDPIYVFDYPDNAAMAIACESLLRQNPDLTVGPGLAESVEYTDPNTLVITLRDGVTFWDGTPLTPEDVVFSLERQRDPNLGGFYGAVFANVDTIEATGDLEVTMTMTAQDMALIGELSGPVGAIVQQAFTEEQGAELRDGCRRCDVHRSVPAVVVERGRGRHLRSLRRLLGHEPADAAEEHHHQGCAPTRPCSPRVC